jgi:hypothetical protein
MNYEQPCKIPYEVICNTEYMSIEYLKTTLSSEQVRKELLQNGIKTAASFLVSLSVSHSGSTLEDCIQELS